MQSSRPFVPLFLKRFDRSLLLNNPVAWSARTHLVIYFGLLFAVLLSLLCVLMFTDVRQESGLGIITGFTVVIAIIGFVFWLIFLLRFNVFKRFGNWRPWDGLKTYLLFFLNVLLIIAMPFLPAAVETFMANRQFSDAELINDTNEMNLAVNRLEYAKLPHQWVADTVHIVPQQYSIDANTGDTILETNDTAVAVYRPHVSYINKRDLESRLNSADSSLKVNDSLYYFYAAPDYLFISGYNISSRGELKVLSNKEIYYAAIRDYRQPERQQLEKKMHFFKNKYSGSEGYDYYYSNENQPGDIDNINKKYRLYAINNMLNSIAAKKYRWENDFNFSFHFMYYAALILSLLVFIFRHSTVKTFFVSLLASVVIAIFTGLFFALGDLGEQGGYTLLFFYFIAFAAIGISAKVSRTRSMAKGVALNYFLFFVPYFPVLATAFYFAVVQHRGILTGYYEAKIQYFFYAEILGFILLLALIEPVFRRLYRAWYAAPEE